MPINGLMVTLSSDPELAQQACGRIRERGVFELGELKERWLPLVVESGDDGEAREQHRWLESVEGVDQVGVILVAFDEPKPE